MSKDKRRNLLSILVSFQKRALHHTPQFLVNEVNLQSTMMLDCGEGTFNQLIRFMGEEVARSTLRELKLVFISHHHKDHHTGLPTLLMERQNAFKSVEKEPSPIYILATLRVIMYLQNMHRLIPILKNVILINNSALVKDKKQNVCHYNRLNHLCDSLNFENLSLTRVPHCTNSFGIAFSHNDGWKIVYSGDCMPNKNLVKIGLNCDLLIHEATFEDGMEEDARRKNHSTVSQAIKIGREMNAKHIILNHFSQRYNKIPLLDEEIMQKNVGISLDFMQVRFEDLEYLPLIYPTLKEMFYTYFEKSSIKSYRRSKVNELT